ncbi:hypothetical protein BH09DEP1_BH09DEP1_3640 [soil metagenome]
MNKKIVFLLLSLTALTKAEPVVPQLNAQTETSNLEHKFIIMAEINNLEAWEKLPVIRFINALKVSSSNKWLVFAETTREQGLYILKHPFVLHAKTRKIQ